MRVGPVAVAVCVLALGGCSSDRLPRVGDDTSSLGKRFGACPDKRAEPDDPMAGVTAASNWYLVTAVPAATSVAVERQPSTNLDVELEAQRISATGPRQPRAPVTITMHSSAMAAVEWAVDQPGRAATAMVGTATDAEASTGPPVATIVMVRVADGWFVPGACQDDAVRKPLADRFGADLTAVLDDATGFDR